MGKALTDYDNSNFILELVQEAVGNCNRIMEETKTECQKTGP